MDRILSYKDFLTEDKGHDYIAMLESINEGFGDAYRKIKDIADQSVWLFSEKMLKDAMESEARTDKKTLFGKIKWLLKSKASPEEKRKEIKHLAHTMFYGGAYSMLMYLMDATHPVAKYSYWFTMACLMIYYLVDYPKIFKDMIFGTVAIELQVEYDRHKNRTSFEMPFFAVRSRKTRNASNMFGDKLSKIGPFQYKDTHRKKFMFADGYINGLFKWFKDCFGEYEEYKFFHSSAIIRTYVYIKQIEVKKLREYLKKMDNYGMDAVTNGCIIDIGGSKMCFEDGRIHAEDEPAIIFSDDLIQRDQERNKNTWGKYRINPTRVMWYNHGGSYKPKQEHVDDWLRAKLKEDRSYAKTPAFMEMASDELKREIPELGSDFKFFED